jgi:hypothetical protein
MTLDVGARRARADRPQQMNEWLSLIDQSWRGLVSGGLVPLVGGHGLAPSVGVITHDLRGHSGMVDLRTSRDFGALTGGAACHLAPNGKKGDCRHTRQPRMRCNWPTHQDETFTNPLLMAHAAMPRYRSQPFRCRPWLRERLALAMCRAESLATHRTPIRLPAVTSGCGSGASGEPRIH